MPFWKLLSQSEAHPARYDSPKAFLVVAGGVSLLESEARRAGLSALAKSPTIRLARQGGLRAHEASGQDIASLHPRLAQVSGLLALASASEACISAGWCHRVLLDTRWKATHLASFTDWRTRRLLTANVACRPIEKLKKPADRVLAAAILTGELMEYAAGPTGALQSFAPSLNALQSAGAKGCTPLRHLLAISAAVYDTLSVTRVVGMPAVEQKAARWQPSYCSSALSTPVVMPTNPT